MKKAIGILCIIVSVISFGWKLSLAHSVVRPGVQIIDIGYLRVTKDSVIQIKNGELSNVSGDYVQDHPIVYKLNDILLLTTSLFCFIAGIALLRKSNLR